MRLKHLLIIYVLSMAWPISTLQAQRYPFTSVTLKDGLPQSAIYGIVQDHQGYMWFATGGGVCRYDGVEFKTYTYYSGFDASHTQDLEMDANRRLWVATFGRGLAFFDGNTFQCFNEANGFKYTHIKNIFFSREGDLWLSVMDYGVLRIYMKGGGIKIRWFDEIQPAFKSKRISQLSDGDITVGGVGGYIRFDKDKNYRSQFISMPNVIFKVVEDKSGGLWIVGRNILYYQRGDSLIDHSSWVNTGTTVDVFDVLLPDDEEYIYIATSIGVLKIRNERAELLTMESGLPVSYTNMLYKDHFGNVWAGTNDGACILNDRGMAHYESDLQGGNLSSFSMAEDPYGQVLIAKPLVGYMVCNDSGLFRLPIEFPAPFDPQQTYCGYSGDLYSLANFNTIYRFNDHKIEWTWKLPDSITRLNAFLPLEDGNSVLLGTSSGAFILNEQNGKLNRIKNLEGINFVVAFYDPQKNIWFCEDRGEIYKIRNGMAIDMTQLINPQKEIIKHALYDRFNNAIWLATERGVLAWNGVKTYGITTHNGLKSNLNYCITQDSLGRIWCGNLQGLDCIDVDQMKITHFGFDQGFLPIETNGRAAITDSKGNVWIGAANATSKIKVNELGKDTIDGVLRLQSIYINEVEKYTENYYDSTLPILKLKHDENSLVFNVASICYTNAKNTLYHWKLEGVDKHWNKRTNHREIEYFNLPPGSYKLRVKAENPDGFETNEVVILVYIAKPFWQTGIFYGSEVLVFMLIVFLSFRFSKKASKNRFGQVMTLLTILIVFESLMLYISSYTDRYTHGIPVFQLVMNILLAASLYPLEQRIKKIMERSTRKS